MASHLVATSRHSEIEIASALARRCREGDLTAEDRDRALVALRQDLRSFLLIEVRSTLGRRSVTLLKRHPLRAADALQLASCLELEKELRLPVLFVAYDRRLNQAAKKERLEVAIV